MYTMEEKQNAIAKMCYNGSILTLNVAVFKAFWYQKK